uniref:ENDD1 protein n=1 Tax=Varanus komodoensis TaxID=61221 RepID=A0A8D2L0Y4_VARKO
MSSFAGLLPVLLSLSACFLIPAPAEVHDTFANCLQFFLDREPPQVVHLGHNYARICQRYNNAYRFATLYDRQNRIPVYSAYIYSPGVDERNEDWFVEPQNIGSNRREMEDERSQGIFEIFVKINASQAVSADYRGVFEINRGQLNPNSHQPDADSRTATFTMTDAVPQYNVLNGGTWADYKASVAQRAQGCRETYIVTGAVPGNNYISACRINKPSHIWSAGCCVIDNNHKRSWAVIAQNDENKITQMTLRRLQDKLRHLYNTEVDLFHSSCYPD